MVDRPNSEPKPGIPRWVNLGGVAAAILAVLMVVAHLGLKNLGGHTSPSAFGSHSPSSVKP